MTTGGATAAAGSVASAGALAVAGSAAAGTSAVVGGASGAPAATAGVSGVAGSKGTAGTGAAGGCGTESFAAIYQSILMNPTYNCAGALCHGRDAASAASVGNLSLSSASVAYMQLVKKASDSATCSGKTRVVPGDPTNSLLVQKLRGQNTTCGAAMPVNGDEIPDEDLKRITDWISAGACNN